MARLLNFFNDTDKMSAPLHRGQGKWGLLAWSHPTWLRSHAAVKVRTLLVVLVALPVGMVSETGSCFGMFPFWDWLCRAKASAVTTAGLALMIPNLAWAACLQFPSEIPCYRAPLTQVAILFKASRQLYFYIKMCLPT